MGRKLSFFIFFVFVSSFSFGQVKDTVVNFKGKEYCIHAMQKGETLFQLSRTYQMAYSKIKEANPEQGDAIALGTAIRIPCKYIKNQIAASEGVTNLKDNTTPQKQNDLSEVTENQSNNPIVHPKKDTVNFIYHEVKAKETLYSLSKKYDLSTLRIMMDNPQVAKEGLKAGDVIKVFKGIENANLPAKNDEIKDELNDEDKAKKQSRKKVETETVLTDSSNVKPQTGIVSLVKQIAAKGSEVTKSEKDLKKYFNQDSIQDLIVTEGKEFRLGLMLPFNFEKNRESMNSTEDKEEAVLLSQTSYFVEFYQGYQLALDSLSKKGLNIRSFIYDCKSDTNEISKLIKRPEFDSLNMVVGPAFSENFTYLSNQLKNKNTYLVSPYGKGKVIVKDNPRTIKIKASKSSRVKVLADYLFKYRKNDNIIFVYEKESEKELLEKLQQELISSSLLTDSILVKTPKIVKGIYEPLAQLKMNVSNVVICFSTDESFATKLVAKLQTRHKDYEISAIGMEEWKDYKNIEIVHWNALDVHLVGNLDFRYSTLKDSSFFKQYFMSYNTEPGYHAILGYETTLHILSNIQNNQYTHSQITGKLKEGDLGDYKFKYNTGNQGIENKGGAVYRYKNYQFIKQY